MQSRLDLSYEAAQEAADARDAACFEQDMPICIYDLATALGATVLFVDINMEGIYERGPPAKILLSPYRPLGRRAFTCGHELGHYRFGHGSTIYELQIAHKGREASEISEEILANSFAAFVLMPPLGIQRAFDRRNTSPSRAGPLEIYTIACDFGVGYSTLVTHLAFGLEEIQDSRRRELERWHPQELRRQVLGRSDPAPLLILDEHGESATLDAEVGYGLLAPTGSAVSGGGLMLERQTEWGDVFRVVRRGVTRIETSLRAVDIRVMPSKYFGLARFRFMEDLDDES